MRRAGHWWQPKPACRHIATDQELFCGSRGSTALTGCHDWPTCRQASHCLRIPPVGLISSTSMMRLPWPAMWQNFQPRDHSMWFLMAARSDAVTGTKALPASPATRHQHGILQPANRVAVTNELIPA